MAAYPVSIAEDDTHLTVTLDDGKANALSVEVLASLRDAVSKAVESDKALVLVGRDGYFCAGFDLSIMLGDEPDARRSLLRDGSRLFQEIMEAPIPVVVACTGHALAGGAVLLLSADWRVGTLGQYRIGLNEVRIGMTLPEMVIAMARHRLNPRDIGAATMLAETPGPERAVEMGYLDSVTPDAVVAARAAAEDFADMPRDAFAATKHRVRRVLLDELDGLQLSN